MEAKGQRELQSDEPRISNRMPAILVGALKMPGSSAIIVSKGQIRLVEVRRFHTCVRHYSQLL